MKVQVLHLVLICFISFDVISQNGTYDFETEIPITMSMTPLIDTSKSISEENGFDMLTISDDEYKVNFLSHAIKKFSYGIAIRLEDGLPIYDSVAFFRELSFFDVSLNYEHHDFNFSVSMSNLLNFTAAIIELEPYLERPSLVAEEIYFNHEPTSMIQASVQYKF